MTEAETTERDTYMTVQTGRLLQLNFYGIQNWCHALQELSELRLDLQECDTAR